MNIKTEYVCMGVYVADDVDGDPERGIRGHGKTEAEAINHLVAELIDHAEDAAYELGKNAGKDEAAAKISDTHKWIPVSERLPEQRRRSVLVHCAERANTYTAYLDEGEATAIDPFWQPWRHFGGDGGEVYGVTHWMPLPEAPK